MSLECNYSESEIYSGLKTNQPWAADCLYTNYFNSTTLPVYQKGGTMDDRREVFQEAIIVFIRKVRSGNFIYQEGKLGGFLRRIVELIWKTNLRKNKKIELRAEMADRLEQSEDGDILQHFEREERRKKFNHLLKLLTEKCKDIILQRYREQVPEKVLAEKWGFGSTKALQVARNRCLKNLKNQVNPSS